MQTKWGGGDYNGDYSTFRACYPKKQQSLFIQQAVAHILLMSRAKKDNFQRKHLFSVADLAYMRILVHYQLVESFTATLPPMSTNMMNIQDEWMEP